MNRDTAWYQIVDAIPDLSDTTRNAFLTLAKDWERREGHNYRYPENDQQVTLIKTDSSAGKTDNPQPQSPPSSQTMLTGTLDPAHLPAHDRPRPARVPRPHEDNAPEQIKLTLQPLQKTNPPAATGHTAPMQPADDFFGPNTILLIYFKNFPQPLRISIANDDELFIGRSTANAAMAPEIDLNVVNASEFGVSRTHAAITRRDNKLLITDLGSMNYTYVNGMRLFPNEIYILKDGDEIQFAQLKAQIRFQRK